MDYKKAFYSKLEDVYLGAKIKNSIESNMQNQDSIESMRPEPRTLPFGKAVDSIKSKSGFSNLLQIKQKYFEHIKNYLDTAINASENNTSEKNTNKNNKNENNTSENINDKNREKMIYNYLYTFFDSYLNESGTPFFNDTPMYKNIYAKVYSNSKDTSLFYKTQNLYYVKSDTIYQSMTLSTQDESLTIYFDASDYKQNADNAKSKVIFKLDSINTESITLKVLNDKQKDLLESTKESANVFKSHSNELSEEFIKILKQHKLNKKEEDILKLIKSYKKQTEIDFFIHKNAYEFLKEQFDLWLFSHTARDLDTDFSLASISLLQDVRRIALRLIAFIADFENELKAIWLKPKFAKNTQYVFSLDILLKQDSKILESIAYDEGFMEQIKEWQELNLIDFSLFYDEQGANDENKQNLDSINDINIDKIIHALTSDSKYRYLPIDTKHFSIKTRYKILSSFENLESILNGELIKADNFQALNTILPKYQNKIDLIYIDPPFNTGSDFEYKDKFQDSTWLTLMENRLELAKKLLSDRGSFYLHLDEKADYFGKILLDKIFDSTECKKITFDTNATKDEESDLFGYKSFGNNFALKSSTIFFLKKELSCFNKLWKPNRNITKLDLGQLDLIAKANNTFPKKIEDYNYFIEKWDAGVLKLQQIDICNEKIYPIGDIWNDLYSFTQSEMRVSENISFYSSQKPENMLRRIIQASSDQTNCVCDFFTGSGTTLAVAHKLNRKYLGIEMGEHFNETYITHSNETKQEEKRMGLLGRMKNVIAGDSFFYAIDKKRRSTLSQKLNYKGGGAFVYYELESYEEALDNCEYVMDSVGIIDYNKSRKLIKSLNKNERINLNMNDMYRKDFDIFITISNLLGLKIKRLFLDSKNIESCEYENGEILNLNNIDLQKYPKLKNLIWWERS